MRRSEQQCGNGDPGRVLTAFESRVAETIRAIPRGRTLSYSGVALEAGKPGAARAVVRAMKHLCDIPWWRVIRRDGTLAVQVATEQAKRLRAEGVTVQGRRVLTPAEKRRPR